MVQPGRAGRVEPHAVEQRRQRRDHPCLLAGDEVDRDLAVLERALVEVARAGELVLGGLGRERRQDALGAPAQQPARERAEQHLQQESDREVGLDGGPHDREQLGQRWQEVGCREQHPDGERAGRAGVEDRLPVRDAQRLAAQALAKQEHREADADACPVDHHQRLLDAEESLAAERDQDDDDRARALDDDPQQGARDEAEHERSVERDACGREPLRLLDGRGGALELREAEEQESDAQQGAERTGEGLELAIAEAEAGQPDQPQRGEVQVDRGEEREDGGAGICPGDHRKRALERQEAGRDEAGEQERDGGCALAQGAEGDAEHGRAEGARYRSARAAAHRARGEPLEARLDAVEAEEEEDEPREEERKALMRRHATRPFATRVRRRSRQAPRRSARGSRSTP